jgi:DNA repair protein RecO (recombination protein O)
MEWSDSGFVVGTRPLNENGAIAELFTSHHGRVQGYVHGGGGKRMGAILQVGNGVTVHWKARISEQLGSFSPIELETARAAAIMQDGGRLAAATSLMALLHAATAMQQDYPGLHEATTVVLDILADSAEGWPAVYVRWELGLLTALGYGLDLSVCAMTGQTQDLAWVSPKTGRAATRKAGEPFADRLLELPRFLQDAESRIEADDVAHGFALTGWFLEKRVFDRAGEGLPQARRRLIETLGRSGLL